MLPKSPENHYTDALYFLSLGLLDRSLTEFLSAIDKGSTEPDAYNNAAAILLFKGRFSEAFKLFKLNWQKNKDEDAAKFLDEVHDLNAFIKNYNIAIEYISDSRYKEALKILNKEAAQGYRVQNGEILRCILYYLQENYGKSREILNDIHEVDRECEFYLYMSRVLDNKKHSSLWKSVLAGVLVGVLLISNTSLAITLHKRNQEIASMKSSPAISQTASQTPTKQAVLTTAAQPTTMPTPAPTVVTPALAQQVAEVTPAEDANVPKILSNLSKYLSSGDLYSFEKEKSLIDISKLNSDDKKSFDSLNNSFMKKSENYFYNNGLSLYKEKNYSRSLEYFKIAYKYKNGSYLDQHVVFFTALLTKINSIDSEKYFLEYVSTYKDGCYMDEVLYNLSVIYNKKGNIAQAKKYALLIQKNYSSSGFYNDTIKNILNK